MATINVATNNAAFHPRRLGHVNFWANDHQAVAAFYGAVVGVEEVYRRPSVPAIFMSNGNTYHDVAFMDLAGPRGQGRSAGLHHFSLELENERELVDGFRRAQDAGFEFDLTLSADVAHSAYGDDPDGNRFEMYADVKPDWREKRAGVVPAANVRWTPGETEPLEQSFYPVDPEIIVIEDAIFHPKRVSHVVLITKDHAAMFQHYTQIAGLRLLAGSADGPFAVLGGSLNEETLTLFPGGGNRKAGLHHFGMELPGEEELDSAKTRLAAKGMKPEFEIDHPSRRSLYLRDPNNQLIQFHVTRRQDPESWCALPEELALFVA